MSCPRCLADPQPESFGPFGSPRTCAFDVEGRFTPENWNCATICLLLELAETKHQQSRQYQPDIWGEDESMQIVWGQGHDHEHESGWVIFTRYKHRGCTSSAVHCGDFWPPRPLTIELADHLIQVYEAMEEQNGL